MERVRCAPAMRRGVGERLDDLQLLDDRARPPMRNDQRQRVLVAGTDVDEMNVKPVDLGHELRQRVQLGFCRAPVVLLAPVVCQLLHHRQRHALRVIGHRLALGPSRCAYAPAQVVERVLWKIDAERANGRVCCHGTPFSDEPRRKRLQPSTRSVPDALHN